MNRRNYIINENSTIEDAIKKIELNSQHSVFIVNEYQKLIGIVTDGDIRRAFLAGSELSTSITKIMNKNFISASQIHKPNEIYELMNNNKLSQIPVVDSSFKLLDIYFIDQFNRFSSDSCPVVVMAGGKGTRLKDLNLNCPKPMVPINGVPMLEILLKQYKKHGFNDFYISVNHLKEQIIEYFGDGRKFEINIRYLVEDTPLGTAGSLYLLKNQCITDSFLLTNADILTKFNPCNLLDHHSSLDSLVTICTRKEITKIPFGVLEIRDNHVEEIKEKPILTHQVNAGIYMIRTAALDYIENSLYLDMPNFIHYLLSQQKKIGVYAIDDYWIDIGVPETLHRARLEWD